jgi:hypothetical protein
MARAWRIELKELDVLEFAELRGAPDPARSAASGSKIPAAVSPPRPGTLDPPRNWSISVRHTSNPWSWRRWRGRSRRRRLGDFVAPLVAGANLRLVTPDGQVADQSLRTRSRSQARRPIDLSFVRGVPVADEDVVLELQHISHASSLAGVVRCAGASRRRRRAPGRTRPTEPAGDFVLRSVASVGARSFSAT